MLLPRNEYLLTHHAALTPNTTLSGTEITTATTVSLSADSASGSRIAVKNAPRPFFKPWDTTINSGSSRNRKNTSQPRLIRMRRDSALPRRAALAEDAADIDDWDMFRASLWTFDAPLQQVDQQQDKGNHQHQYANGGGASVVVLVELDHDQQRQDLGLHRHVAGDEDHRAVLTDATGKRQGEAGQPGRQQRGHEDVAEHLQRLGAQAGGGFFDFPGDIGEDRLHRAHHERQRDESQRQGDAQGAVGDLETQVGGELADQAGRRVQRGQRDTGDGGGQGERQVDHRIDDLATGEGVAHQHPGQQRTDHAIDQRGVQRGAETQFQCRQHTRCGDDVPELIPGKLSGVYKHRREGDEYDQAEVHHGVAQRQPEAGYDGGNTTRHKSPWLAGLTHKTRR